ncbi:MAG: hypothetical protein ACOYMA_14715 [Bacteroidia bacterium]
MKKLIEKTDNYSIYEAAFMGYTQIFRQWDNNHVEIKFTDNFARANGHRNINDMLNSNPGMRESLMLTCGSIPEWITIDDKGNFTVKNTVSNIALN